MKAIKPHLLLVLLHFCTNICAIDNNLAGSRMTGMASCGVAIPDVWSVSHNQAGLAFLQQNFIAFEHQQRFLLKQLGSSNLAIAIPFSKNCVGFQYSYFGYANYSEMKTGLAYAIRINPKISLGLQMDYFRSSIPVTDYKAQYITFEAGILVNPLESMFIGFHVFNPLPEKWNKNDDAALTNIAKAGASYYFANTLLLTTETQFSSNNNTIVKLGLEYTPLKIISFRLGVLSGNYNYSFGFSYKYKKFHLGMAFLKHQVLGTSPSIDIIYAW